MRRLMIPEAFKLSIVPNISWNCHGFGLRGPLSHKLIMLQRDTFVWLNHNQIGGGVHLGEELLDVGVHRK